MILVFIKSGIGRCLWFEEGIESSRSFGSDSFRIGWHYIRSSSR
jgi:hypothetical protein